MGNNELQLANKLKSDSRILYRSWVCYIMATVEWEADGTFLPIAERGHGQGHKYGIPDPITKQTYYGRGYVQLTWKWNYEQFGKLLNIDLVNNPDLAMQPDTAYEILVVGMIKGLFTGKRLLTYLDGAVKDYFDARKIVNGLDQAQHIANLAKHYEQVLYPNEKV